MKIIVVYGGRFQPPHKGHKASFDHLVKRFGDNVYMASADKMQGPSDPFTWNEKKKLAAVIGIPPNNFVKVKNVYALPAIKEAIPIDDNTVVILAVSEKDGDRLVSKNVDAQGYALKKNGDRAAIQWLPKNTKNLSPKYLYAVKTPTVTFPIGDKKVTGATQIRDLYAASNDKVRQQILLDLYGTASPAIKKLFDKNLRVMQNESVLREYIEFVNKF